MTARQSIDRTFELFNDFPLKMLPVLGYEHLHNYRIAAPRFMKAIAAIIDFEATFALLLASSGIMRRIDWHINCR